MLILNSLFQNHLHVIFLTLNQMVVIFSFFLLFFSFFSPFFPFFFAKLKVLYVVRAATAAAVLRSSTTNTT